MQSKSLTNDDGAQTIRLGPMPKDCPIDLLDIAAQCTSETTSFLQIESISAVMGSTKIEARNHLDESTAVKNESVVSFMQMGVPLSEPVGRWCI